MGASRIVVLPCISPMNCRVEAYIANLEQMLHQLNEELMEQDDVRLRNALEARLRAADQTLKHLHALLALPQRVREKP